MVGGDKENSLSRGGCCRNKRMGTTATSRRPRQKHFLLRACVTVRFKHSMYNASDRRLLGDEATFVCGVCVCVSVRHMAAMWECFAAPSPLKGVLEKCNPISVRVPKRQKRKMADAFPRVSWRAVPATSG